jgi:hypothetical protein
MRHNIDILQAAGVIAAHSPGQQWERNIESADKLIGGFVAGFRGEELIERYKGCSVYGKLALTKCESILLGENPIEVLSGPKVLAFYDCIIDAWSEAVCIDRHARMCALGLGRSETNSIVKSQAEFNWIGKHFIKVAAELNIRPYQLQAICWVWFRNNVELESKKEIK